MRFAEPWALFLLLLLPLVAFLLWRRRRLLRPKMYFSSLGILGERRMTLRQTLRPLPVLMILAATALLIVALARPQSAWSEHKRITEGIDIMLVMDVSESMRALDFEPNRLEVAKQEVKKFISGRQDDQIGIVIFGKDTFTLAPLTRDYAALETFVDRIDFDLVDGRATAIGMGLANAINKLKDSPAKSKVVVLLTDGDNNWGKIHPVTAAEIAQQLDVRVYTIGVGTQGIVRIPVQIAGHWVAQQWRSNIDTETLELIAEMTGGKSFMATDEARLQEIYAEIDKLERTEIEVVESNYFDELAHLLIVPALLMLGAAFLLEQTWLLSFP